MEIVKRRDLIVKTKKDGVTLTSKIPTYGEVLKKLLKSPMYFGKHNGKTYEEVLRDTNYIKWVSNLSNPNQTFIRLTLLNMYWDEDTNDLKDLPEEVLSEEFRCAECGLPMNYRCKLHFDSNGRVFHWCCPEFLGVE